MSYQDSGSATGRRAPSRRSYPDVWPETYELNSLSAGPARQAADVQSQLSEATVDRLKHASAACLSLIKPPEGKDGSNYTYYPADLDKAEEELRDTYRSETENTSSGCFGSRSTGPAFDQERLRPSVDDEQRPYLDALGQITWHPKNTDHYLNPQRSDVRPLIVQAASSASQGPEPSWARTQLRGDVPLAFRMVEWSQDKRLGAFESFFRQTLVALPLQFLISFPGIQAPWEMLYTEPTYHDYPDYHWKWPKHAINTLDSQGYNRNGGIIKPYELSTKQRLVRPRQLIVKKDNGEWELDPNPQKNLPYVFISYNWDSFDGQDDKISAMAQLVCEKGNLTAYYHDQRCNAPQEQAELLTADVYRMSDVVRGSNFVAVLLPNDLEQSRLNWGERMWTLPEALLAPGRLRVCTWSRSGGISVSKMGKVELSQTFWLDSKSDGEEETRRNLAEHFDGGISLSRLELFSAAISALSAGKTKRDYTGADAGYAMMGLLRYRFEPDSSDDLFQVIARLSLSNDSDRLVERLISMFPSINGGKAFWDRFSSKDQYGTFLWDIEPRCQVVGVGDEQETVLLGECRAVPIQWESFPRVTYRSLTARKKTLSELAIRSGAWWLVAGITLAFTFAPIFISYGEIEDAFDRRVIESGAEDDDPEFQRWFWRTIVIFIGVGIVLAFFAPRAAHNMLRAAIVQPAPHLVGFEGTLPRDQLEELIFGRDAGRLKYDPSSTPWAQEMRHPFIRRGIEPGWIQRSEPTPTSEGYRWFTLVDTGNLSISIFQARRPPTVALITGAEGGMLRAVLCSWSFVNDCHYRETVIRVQSNTWERSKTAAWIKVSLLSQDEFTTTHKHTTPGAEAGRAKREPSTGRPTPPSKDEDIARRESSQAERTLQLERTSQVVRNPQGRRDPRVGRNPQVGRTPQAMRTLASQEPNNYYMTEAMGG